MPLTEEERKERERAYGKKYREANKEKLRAKSRSYKKRNREMLREKQKAYYALNRDTLLSKQKEKGRYRGDAYTYEYQREYRKKNKKKWMADPAWRERRRQSKANACLKLTDGYIRDRLTMACGLRAKHIPQSLIKAKRAYIKGIRFIKGQEDERQKDQEHG